jgi:hypothetical protein
MGQHLFNRLFDPYLPEVFSKGAVEDRRELLAQVSGVKAGFPRHFLQQDFFVVTIVQ